MRRAQVAVVVVVVAAAAAGVEGIMFHLQPNTQKCFKEEIHKNVLVSGEYEVQEAQGQKVDIQVTDSKGHHLYNKEEADNGKFIFNTEDYDVYEICFVSRVPPKQRATFIFQVQLWLCKFATGSENLQCDFAESNFFKTFVTSKSLVQQGHNSMLHHPLGEAAKLKPLEIELKRLEDLSESIVQDFSYMRQREEEMRDTNDELPSSLASKVKLRSSLCFTKLMDLASSELAQTQLASASSTTEYLSSAMENTSSVPSIVFNAEIMFLFFALSYEKSVWAASPFEPTLSATEWKEALHSATI
ncbi:Transmembrane emp24 domain-containing protein bai [Portunus trituberculatus]|uniref:Transmembrane emp24 domain-containing protein bai n=1 Tax=Portunus trituberculatus TaxID=210409 RepID=A0A5B7CEV2_PORTR|nr:Transmembrane emp24 domain-containing protein bai [Portunus trituberculatus]